MSDRHVHWWSIEDDADCGCCAGCASGEFGTPQHPYHYGAVCSVCGHDETPEGIRAAGAAARKRIAEWQAQNEHSRNEEGA